MSTNIVTLREAVASRIADSNEVVFELVAQKLAQEEVDKRVALVLQHYTEVDNIDKELKKLKPDLWTGQSYEGYSKDTFDKRLKLDQRRAKVQSAILSALSDHDYSLLKNLGENKDVSKTA